MPLSTGATFASAGTTNSGLGTIGWTNPGNILSDNGLSAVSGTMGTTNVACYDYSLYLVNPTTDAAVGSNLGDTVTVWPVVANSTVTYGGPLNLCGCAFTVAEINDTDFGCQLEVSLASPVDWTVPLRAKFSFAVPTWARPTGYEIIIEKMRVYDSRAGGSNKAQVDWIKMNVYYVRKMYPETRLATWLLPLFTALGLLTLHCQTRKVVVT